MKDNFNKWMFLWVALLVNSTSYGDDLGRRKIMGQYKLPANGQVKMLLFDADSTLRVDAKGKPTSDRPADVVFIPDTGTTIAEYVRKGYFIGILSNQGGVGKFVTLKNADANIKVIVDAIRAEGGEVHYFDFAEGQDRFRKPNTGMGDLLIEKIKKKWPQAIIDKANSLYVGDSAYKKASPGKAADIRPDGRPGFNFSNSDRYFAKNFGIGFAEPQKFFGWEQYGVELVDTPQALNELELNRCGD